MKLIERHIQSIISLCKKYCVKRLYVFGSILTDRFNDKSDVDFSIVFDNEKVNERSLDWADLFFDLLHELEALLGRKVDIVFDNNISNPIFRHELDETKRLIYG
ncbi:MAG: nucleotidyltransferase domain-containing protein [Muribaculaceae bacterium]|nr:nucleotidyltransferase domain-containing protein [Bacteroides sp.]MDE6226463.1 nucleotidyltransferase domain-containing protein [Muribaculaceae bacterium]